MFLIDPANQPPYSFWLGLGLLVALAYSQLLARFQGAARLEVLAMLGLCGVGALLGAPLVGLVFRPGGELSWAGGSSVGIMLGGVVVAGVLYFVVERRRWLGLVDVVVPAGLLGLGVAHLGCLFRGCDFGRVTEASWAVAYARGSGPWFWHQVHHGLGFNGAQSLGTHPFGAYLGGGAIVVVAALTLWSLRRRGFPPGTMAALSALGYLVVRFIAEFTREPVTLRAFGQGFHALHPMLLLGIGAVLLLWYRGVYLVEREQA